MYDAPRNSTLERASREIPSSALRDLLTTCGQTGTTTRTRQKGRTNCFGIALAQDEVPANALTFAPQLGDLRVELRDQRSVNGPCASDDEIEHLGVHLRVPK